MFLSVVANKCFYFREDVEKAKSSGDWKTVYDFYLTTFDSFPELSAAFKVITHNAHFSLFKSPPQKTLNLPLFLPNIGLSSYLSKYKYVLILKL